MAQQTFTFSAHYHPLYNLIILLCGWFPVWSRKKLGHIKIISFHLDGDKTEASSISVEDVFKSLEEDEQIQLARNFKGPKKINLN